MDMGRRPMGLSLRASGKSGRKCDPLLFSEGDKQFRNAILSMRLAVYTTDDKGRITLFNDTAAKMWGRKPKIGEDMWCGSWRIFKTDGTPLAHDQCPMALTLRAGKGVHGHEIIIERPDGTRACVLPYPEPLRDDAGKLVGAVNLLVDITDRKQAEQQILQLNSTLEARVNERTELLLDRTAQLETFCYSLAHDLRQHIRGVSLNARMAKELMSAGGNEGADALERLINSARSMESIVTDVLEYARSGSLDIHKRHVDFSELACHMKNEMHEIYGDVTIEVQPGLSAFCDREGLRLVLRNLLDNACKYTDPTRPNNILVGSSVKGAFFVRDTGAGFDMAYADRVFLPFERLHSNDRISGSGIGLAIVSKVTQRHGGEAWAQSEAGKGSTFFFTLGDPS